jgi:hypothetical protein
VVPPVESVLSSVVVLSLVPVLVPVVPEPSAVPALASEELAFAVDVESLVVPVSPVPLEFAEQFSSSSR